MILHVPAGSSWWRFAAANLILFLHIAGGTVGIISGAVALLSRKGGRAHRIAGTIFLVSMLTMATIGAGASPFLPVPSMPNVAAGILTLYLVATGWMAIKREDGRIGRFEKGGLGVALGVVALGMTFILMAIEQPHRQDRQDSAASVLCLRARRRDRRRRGPQDDPARRHFRRRADRAASLAHVRGADHRVGLVLSRDSSGSCPPTCGDPPGFSCRCSRRCS